jgi:hypothetical protein
MTRRRARASGVVVVIAASLAAAAGCEGVLDGLSDGGPSGLEAGDGQGSGDGGGDGGDAAPTPEPCPLGAFCDDFESGDLAKWSAIESDPAIAVTVDDSDPRLGEKSLHVVSPARGGPVSYAEVQHRLAAARVSGTIGVRAWFLVHAPLPNDTAIMALRPPATQFPSIALLASQGRLAWFLTDADGGDAPGGTTSTVTIAIGEYVCISVAVTVGVNGRVEAWHGRAKAIDVAVDNLLGGGGYGVVGVGLPTVLPAERTEIWFDDVAIGESALPCP